MRVAVATVLAALASAGAASASCGGGQIDPVTVGAGNWSGVPWKLQAIDSGDGRYGVTAIVAGSRRAALSGRLIPHAQRHPVNFGWTSSRLGTWPAFVAGVVTDAARTITVGLADRTVRTVRTIRARCLLQPDISFFILPVPAGTRPTFFSARTATGKLVASWRR